MAISFIGGGNREPGENHHKSLTNFNIHNKGFFKNWTAFLFTKREAKNIIF
jgi:hypothetical protein